MPAKESGEELVILPKLAALFVVGFILWLIIERANAVAPKAAPTAFVQPTSTFVPNPVILEGQCIDVDVIAKNANPFDSFDVNEVVVRLSDSSQRDDGADSRFLVCSCAAGKSIFAWAPGYEINSVPCDGNIPYNIALTHVDAVDNSYYSWSAAANDCNTCHGGQFIPNERGASYDEMNEWFRSGHAKVFQRRSSESYFESMYRGTTLDGKLGVPAQPVIIDNEWVPVPPELNQDYHGPGFRLDYPQEPGNCAYCHAPAAIWGSQESVHLDNPRPEGVSAEGVTCDVCHKVFEVILADDKNPFPDRPGVLSYRFLRPSTGVFITGPFSNILMKPREGMNLVTTHRSTCTPLFSQSEFCAPCHFGKFGDMVIYNSYGEWRESSFSKDPAATGYRTCQDCHMSHLDVEDTRWLSSQRQACSANNVDFQSFDHNMMDFGEYEDLREGTKREIPRMLKGAAQIDVTFGAEVQGPNTLDVNVKVTNKEAGHKFPTDSPLRHLILVVEAEDRVNTPLIQVDGGRIPNWAGPGPISPVNIVETMNGVGVENYAGLPGKIFANLLVEEETNLSPGMAYWNETKPVSIDSTTGKTSDTRLAPGQPNSSTYSFAAPDEGDVEVWVRLIYRYAFYDLMVWKEWFDRADIVVTEVLCEGPPADPAKMRCIQTEPMIPTPTPTPNP